MTTIAVSAPLPPNNTPSVGKRQVHQRTMVATSVSNRPMGHARVSGGPRHVHSPLMHKTSIQTYRDFIYRTEIHTLRSVIASEHDHQGEEDNSNVDTDYVVRPGKVK